MSATITEADRAAALPIGLDAYRRWEPDAPHQPRLQQLIIEAAQQAFAEGRASAIITKTDDAAALLALGQEFPTHDGGRSVRVAQAIADARKAAWNGALDHALQDIRNARLANGGENDGADDILVALNNAIVARRVK